MAHLPNRVLKALGRRPAMSMALWLFALLLSLPAGVGQWLVAGQRVEFSLLDLVWSGLAWPVAGPAVGDMLWSVTALAYGLGCVGLWCWFAWRCQTKRQVMLWLAVVGMAIEARWAPFGLSRLLIWLAAVSVLLIALEVLRQNRPLLVQLQAAGTSWRPLLWRTLTLWSPSLVLIGAGLYVSAQLGNASLNAIYASGTVQRYCALPGQPERPCTLVELGQGPSPGSPLAELSLRRAVAQNLSDAMWRARKNLLAATEASGQWATPELAMAAFNGHLQSVRLALAPVALSEADDVASALRQDPELQQLVQQRQQALVSGQAEPREVQLLVWLPGGLVHNLLQRQQAAQAVAALDRQIAARRARLRQALDAGNPAAAMKRALLQRLGERLDLASSFPAARQRLAERMASQPAPGAPAVRATARAELLRLLADKQDAVLDMVASSFAADLNLAVSAGLHVRRCLVLLPDALPGDDHIIDCPTGQTGSADPAQAVQVTDFMRNLRLSLDDWVDRAQRGIEAGLTEATLASFKSAEGAERGAAALFDGVPRQIGLRQRPGCGFDLICHATNVAKCRAEAGYREQRAQLQLGFSRTVQRNAMLGRETAHQQTDQARSLLQQDLQRSHAAALRLVEGAHRGFELLGVVLVILLVFSAIKSFLYVLALVVFHETGAADVGFHVPAGPEGSHQHEANLRVPSSFDQPLRSFALGLNQTRRLVLWKPWIASFSRLWRWRWLMNHGGHATQSDIRFPLGPGLTGVQWQLREGEQVVFNFHDLLGFSDNVQIRTEVSLRLSTLLLGSYFFRVATCTQGEGLLLLAFKGAGGNDSEQIETVSVATLKAWNLHTRFRVFGKLSMTSVLKDGFTLSRREPGKAGRGKLVAGASPSGGLSVEGLVWYAKTFLLPI